jgi:hypothetical protein
MRRAIVLALFGMLSLCGATAAQAEVKKIMQMCDGKLCPRYEAVLNLPEGWVLDKDATKQKQVQMLVPKGKNFNNADALIYIKISYRHDKKRPIEDQVRVSEEDWRAEVPDAKIVKLPDVVRDNKKPAFLSARYENPSQKQQPYEIVSFGIDNDTDGNEFSLMVVMTGLNKKALDEAERTYMTLLRTH